MPFICSQLSLFFLYSTHTHTLSDMLGAFFALIFSCVYSPQQLMLLLVRFCITLHSFWLLLLRLLLLRLVVGIPSLSLAQFPSLSTYLYIVHTIPFSLLSFFFALLFAHFRKIFNYKATINYWKRNSTKQTSANTDAHTKRKRADFCNAFAAVPVYLKFSSNKDYADDVDNNKNGFCVRER